MSRYYIVAGVYRHGVFISRVVAAIYLIAVCNIAVAGVARGDRRFVQFVAVASVYPAVYGDDGRYRTSKNRAERYGDIIAVFFRIVIIGDTCDLPAPECFSCRSLETRPPGVGAYSFERLDRIIAAA